MDPNQTIFKLPLSSKPKEQNAADFALNEFCSLSDFSIILKRSSGDFTIVFVVETVLSLLLVDSLSSLFSSVAESKNCLIFF